MAQSSDERVGMPMTVWRVIYAPFRCLAPAIEPDHLCIDSALIYKDEFSSIPLLLKFAPSFSFENYIRTILLLGVYRFFYSESPISLTLA